MLHLGTGMPDAAQAAADEIGICCCVQYCSKSDYLLPGSVLLIRRTERDGQGIVDDCQYAIEILRYIVVPETENLPALRLHECGSVFIVLNPLLMLSAVEFDNEHFLDAGEVGDVGVDGVLAAEAVSVQLLAA
jgi:hypothetical protein|nr:hypothetical protein [Noviherbaspirillum sp.]